MPWNDLSSPLSLAIILPSLTLLLAALWWLLAPGPRRGRALRRLRRLLQRGQWSDALLRVQRLRKKKLPRRWQRSFDLLEADCLDTALDASLQEKKFDDALKLAVKMVALRDLPETAAVAKVQGAMLDELRRLFAAGSTRGVLDFAAHPLLAACREVFFWQALCFLRDGQTERALASLEKGVRSDASDEAGLTETTQDPFASQARRTPLFIDPFLYLGAVLLRRGLAKEALRLLTEANRIDNTCPIVTAQLGSAMIAAGADAGFAVRTLKRALGPKGLAQWSDSPARIWVEAFPERYSYIRKLANKHTFVCPLWGEDLQLMIRQGKLALAQGLYRQGNFQESGDLYNQLLEEGAPSAVVLRGLGIALAKGGKYDDAFKHLRVAHEMEEPKDRLTAGYLALCGARGKPSKPEAKIQNVVWAVRLVSQFNAPKDVEWVAIISELFAEAREHHIPLSLDDQLYLCEHLFSVEATDARAAQAYYHLRSTFPEAVRPEYAWLFCRAVEQHGSAPLALALPPVVTVAEDAAVVQFQGVAGDQTVIHVVDDTLNASSVEIDDVAVEVADNIIGASLALQIGDDDDHASLALQVSDDVTSPSLLAGNGAPAHSSVIIEIADGTASSAGAEVHGGTLDMFALTFAHEAEARAFYQERQWNFDDIELNYLTQTAELAPGSFPASLGPSYAPRGQELLLARALEREKAGQVDQALATVSVLTLLAPANAVALDRLAALHHRLGQQDQALAVLARWQSYHPEDPLPMIRQAVFLFQQGRLTEGHDMVRQALRHSQGRQKGDIALKGARLALHQARIVAPDGSTAFHAEGLKTAREFLDEGVRACPDHLPALECLAAVCWLLDDKPALAAQAANMNRPESLSGRFHYFAALCRWAGGDAAGTLQACQQVKQTANVGVQFQIRPNGDKPRVFEVNLPLESSYLEGLAYRKLEDWARAQAALEPVAQATSSPSAALAQAMLGGVCLAQDQPELAVRWWQTLDAKKRANWQLAEPLSNSMLLSALAAFEAGKFEEAAEKFRTAGKLGCRDRRLGPLLILSLFRAGQAAFFG